MVTPGSHLHGITLSLLAARRQHSTASSSVILVSNLWEQRYPETHDIVIICPDSFSFGEGLPGTSSIPGARRLVFCTFSLQNDQVRCPISAQQEDW